MRTLIVFLLLSTLAPASTKVCKRDKVALNTIAGDAKFDHGKPKLMYVSAERITIPSVAKIRFMLASRRFMYCLPKISRDESPMCRENTEPLDYSEEEMLDSLNSAKCLVGETCNEYACRGEKAYFCTNPKLTKRARPQDLPPLSKATSLFHSTCVQYWGCQLTEKEVNLHLQEDGSIRVDDPGHGEFIFRSARDLYSRGKVGGHYAMIMFPVEEEKKTVQLTCLRESGSHICLDDVSRKVMTLSRKGKTCVGNMCFYCSEGSLIFEEEPQSLGEVPTQFDVVRMYRLLQYQGIQTMWDISQIHARAQQIERVVGKIVEVLTVNTTELVSHLTGVMLRTLSVADGSVTATVCRDRHEEEELFKMINEGASTVLWEEKATNDSLTKARLFWSGKVLDNEVPKPVFEVDKLTYNDIAKLEGSFSGKSQEISNSNEMGQEPWYEGAISFLKNMGIVLGWLSALSIIFRHMRG